MKLLLTALAVFLCIQPAGTVQKSSTDNFTIGSGNQFYDNCALVETISPENDHIQNMEIMFCMGYAEGLSHGVLAADISRAVKTFCFPSAQISNLQIVRIIRKYIADHPERAHEVTAVLAVDALRRAFPCKS